MTYLYEALLEPNEHGGFDARFPDLGIMTQGESLHDAALMAHDLLRTWIGAALRAGEDLPAPSLGHEVPPGGYALGIVADCSPATQEPDTMTAQEAADLLGVSRARIYAMIRDGVLEARKVGYAQVVSTESVKRRFNQPRRVGRPRTRALSS